MNAMSRPCPERDLLLHGLADGELDAANALAMENHLQSCGGCAAAFREILHQKKLFRSDALRFRAPGALRARFLTAIAAENGVVGSHEEVSAVSLRERPRSLWPSSFVQAGTAFSALALAASLILFVNSANRAPRLAEELVAGHVRSLLVSHLTDIASSDQHTVKPWFLGKLDFAPPVVDLAQRDFPLVGGRLDYIGGHVIPALVYKRHGHVINLYIWPAGKTVSPPETLEGYHILSWTQSGFSYAAVSDLNLTELQEFQREFERAIA